MTESLLIVLWYLSGVLILYWNAPCPEQLRVPQMSLRFRSIALGLAILILGIFGPLALILPYVFELEDGK